MADVKNLIVGAADLWISKLGVSRPADVTLGTGIPASQTLGGATTTWRNMGYTDTGLELSYEPNYGEVSVDQLLDAARLFKQGLKVTLKTSLSEATLENMQVAFGQEDAVTVYSGSTQSVVSTLTVSSSSSNATLNISGGALGTSPVERTLVAIGNAPKQIGKTGTAGTDYVDGGSITKKERVYIARRVVSMDTVSHGLKRGEATVFPVTFRCLPDDADAYDGSEYGKIIDRVFGA
jgi:hypothetical protein